LPWTVLAAILAPSAAIAAAYVAAYVFLRGAMAWELSQDSDSHALITALDPILH